MAEKELDASWVDTFVDSSGKADLTGSYDIMVNGLTESLSLWDAINEKAEEYQSKNVTANEAIKALLEDQIAANKKLHDRQLHFEKEFLKIQKQKEGADAKTLKNLEKREKILKQVQEIEKKTADIVSKYEDDMLAKEELRKAEKENLEKRENILKDGLKGGNLGQVKDALTGGKEGIEGFAEATKLIAALVQQLDDTIQQIAKYKADWDTRLYGSGSSHFTLTKAIQYSLGASPYVKQQDVLKNIDKAIEIGIAYNIEQRAFLETIKDDIAGTFDAFDSTLLQIVRIQQSDSTAARMGMEAALNEYLNKMFKTTEYLSNVSDSVTGALYEATSLLSSSQSVGFEYQVQKWLGSLYSVGMSQSGIQSIANALGQLASGDVSGTSSGAGKLLVMAASRAGLSYSDLLTKGINDSQINALMENMVEYLKSIADSNKVVQTQLAGVYGLKTSDIQAASNLSGVDITNIYGNSLDYGGGINALNKMARTVWQRISVGEMMNNVIDNFKYTLSTGIAGNPVLYSLWTISNMLQELTGGIPIPMISVMGNTVDLHTTIADLMRVGAMSGGLLSGIGSLVSGMVTNAAGLQGVLAALGVRSTATTVTRGGGLSSGLSNTTSQISYIGNTSGNDTYNASMASAEDQQNELMVEAQEEEQDDIKLADLNDTAVRIYDLLETVIYGGKLTVAIDDSINGWPRT